MNRETLPSVSGSGTESEIFDVFLCHNSEDKPAVREIAQKLTREGFNPWLDEDQIRPGTSWQAALGQQIKSIKSAAVFVGRSGIGPWQDQEIQAFLNQLVKRKCPVIPAVLASAETTPEWPWTLENLHCVDFRTDLQPLQRLIWGITGQKPAELSDIPSLEGPTAMQEAAKYNLLPSRTEHAAAHKAVSEARLYPPLAEAPDKENTSQLEILRGRVMEYWVDGVLKHSLYSEVLISLGKRPIDKAVDAPWKYLVEMSDATNSAPLDDRGVSAIYDAAGLLLILGEPGSGKTTTLLELAATLLDRARNNIKERLPIVLNLSSWKKKQPVADWISGELSEKYRVPRKIARSWLERDYLLPLLDGLDEVAASMQPDCVAAIDAFIEEFNPSGLVVCCRLMEYQWLPRRLKLNGAICLQSLSFEEVDKYLASGGSKLAALREAVNTDSMLQQLGQTPLMLSIMSLACQGVGGDELARQEGDSPDERRKQIFRLYVEQMFQRKESAAVVFPKEKIIGWLSWLAREVREHSQSVFLVEELQPSWLGTRAQRVAYKIVALVSLGLMLGLMAGLLGSMTTGVSGGVIGGVIGLFAGLITGLTEGRGRSPGESGSLNCIALVETLNWNWKQFWEKTIHGLITGGAIKGRFVVWAWFSYLLIGLGGGMTVGEKYGLIYGLIYGPIVTLTSAVTAGLSAGLIGGFTRQLKVGKAFPNQGIKLSAKNSLAVFLVALPISGLCLGLQYVLFLWSNRSLTHHGLIVGVSVLLGGLGVGLHFGGLAVIKHYALRLTLWVNDYTPFKLVSFLDHCAKLIFLKRVGGGYIFIHRMLLEYFADLPPGVPKAEDGRKAKGVRRELG